MARLLPPELWLHIMRSTNDFGTYNAMARACQLFAALARYEAEEARRRLARPNQRRLVKMSWAQDESFEWFVGNKLVCVNGSTLARGRLHGACLIFCGSKLMELQARDGVWQGEGRLWMPRGPKQHSLITKLQVPADYQSAMLLIRRFHFVDGMLEGRCINYCYNDSSEITRPQRLEPLYSLDWRAEDSVIHFGDGIVRNISYYEAGLLEGYSITVCRDVLYTQSYQGGTSEGPFISTDRHSASYHLTYQEDGDTIYEHYRGDDGSEHHVEGSLCIDTDSRGSLSSIRYWGAPECDRILSFSFSGAHVTVSIGDRIVCVCPLP